MIDVRSPRRPRIVAEYKIPQNTEAFLPQLDPATQQFTSYAAHNPTVTRNLGLLTWRSGGLQAIDLEHPTPPGRAGRFSPTPLAEVATEDPALSGGPNKVMAWSYPIVSKSLVYVVDVRNGLYLLRYTGPHAQEIERLSFLEGNSNLGDAERVQRP